MQARCVCVCVCVFNLSISSHLHCQGTRSNCEVISSNSLLSGPSTSILDLYYLFSTLQLLIFYECKSDDDTSLPPNFCYDFFPLFLNTVQTYNLAIYKGKTNQCIRSQGSSYFGGWLVDEKLVAELLGMFWFLIWVPLDVTFYGFSFQKSNCTLKIHIMFCIYVIPE